MEGDVKLTALESKVLEILCDKEKWIDIAVKRNSNKEFDIVIDGKEDRGEHKFDFSAWIPLSIIRHVDWTSNKIWKLSDGYGSPGYMPVQGHDWSGIRDSSEEAIWKMTKVALRMMGIYKV